jgi:hypothetical protein
LEGDDGAKDKKKKKKHEIKEKALKAKAWLLQAAGDTYGARVL